MCLLKNRLLDRGLACQQGVDFALLVPPSALLCPWFPTHQAGDLVLPPGHQEACGTWLPYFDVGSCPVQGRDSRRARVQNEDSLVLSWYFLYYLD